MVGKVSGNGLNQNEMYQAVLQALLANTNVGGGGGGGTPSLITTVSSSYTVPVGYMARVTPVSVPSCASYHTYSYGYPINSISSRVVSCKEEFSQGQPFWAKSGDVITMSSSTGDIGTESASGNGSGVTVNSEVGVKNAYCDYNVNSLRASRSLYGASGKCIASASSTYNFAGLTVTMGMQMSWNNAMRVELYLI